MYFHDTNQDKKQYQDKTQYFRQYITGNFHQYFGY